MKYVFSVIVSMAAIAFANAQEKKLTISGFSELRLESRFGGPADQEEADLLESTGGRERIYREGTEIYYPGFNLNFLAELNEKLFFQGEINFEAEDLKKIHIEIYRAYIDYRLHPKFNLQLGKFLSPIGYLNRNQRIYGYLNNSVRPREMVWEEYGYIPPFTLGAQVYGTFEATSNAVKYYLAYGQNRAGFPHGQTIAAGHIGNSKISNPGFSGILEGYLPTPGGEISIGLSGYFNPGVKTYLVELGDIFDPLSAVSIDLRETGIAPYFRWDSEKFVFFSEAHLINFTDKTGISSKEKYNYSALSAEIAYKAEAAGKPFNPYVRYDRRHVDKQHPFYGLRSEDDLSFKIFVPDQSELMVGVVWDLIQSNRLKIEYGATFRGAMPKGRLSISSSFAF